MVKANRYALPSSLVEGRNFEISKLRNWLPEDLVQRPKALLVLALPSWCSNEATSNDRSCYIVADAATICYGPMGPELLCG